MAVLQTGCWLGLLADWERRLARLRLADFVGVRPPITLTAILAILLDCVVFGAFLGRYFRRFAGDFD